MVFSPAWGGTIPLVPIGSFRGFLAARRKGKELRQWYASTISKAVLKTALNTAAGKRAAANLTGILRAMGYVTSKESIGVELHAYIAFQKFQQQQAVKRKNEASQRYIESIMYAPGGRIVVSGKKPAGQLIPAEYFKMLSVRVPRPKGSGGQLRLNPDDIEQPAIQAFAIWFERRKRRRGRFSNV